MWQERGEDVWNVIEKHQSSLNEQTNLINTLSVVSPSHHLGKMFNSLSGTSYESHMEFLDYAKRFRRQFLNNMKDKDYFNGSNIRFFSSLTEEEAFNRERLRQAFMDLRDGKLTFDELLDESKRYPLPNDLIPQASDTIESQPDFVSALSGLIPLIIFTALLFVSGHMAFIRYDIR